VERGWSLSVQVFSFLPPLGFWLEGPEQRIGDTSSNYAKAFLKSTFSRMFCT
jgi:hypothetical protein